MLCLLCYNSDFGTSRLLQLDDGRLQTTAMGTAAYMPPELFGLDAPHLSAKVDIYSLGVLMYLLFTLHWRGAVAEAACVPNRCECLQWPQARAPPESP